MLERKDTALLVIDFQEALSPKIFNINAIVPRVVKLIHFARQLQLPTIATEQYPRGLGATTAPIAHALGEVPRLAKTSFGCLGDQGFAQALAATECTQLLVCGIETHVCVMQTILAALDQGYHAFVVRDGVGSRHQSDHEAALARMTAAGATLVTSEMAMFEIIGDAATPEFKKLLSLIKNDNP